MNDPGLDLSALLAEPLPATLKGLAARAVGLPLARLGTLGLSLFGDLPLPAAVLDGAALEHNAAWMQRFAARAGVGLCPHGKTTMAPQLFDLQLRQGAWGITLATAAQLRTARHFGVRRVLLANQLVDAASIALVLDELARDAGFEVLVLVDSVAGAERLAAAAERRRLARPLRVLLEVGLAGGRAGVRSREEGAALGRRLRQMPALALCGIEAFEGIAPGDDHQAELAVLMMLDDVAALAAQGLAEDWFAPGELLLSAGGSAFFDMVARLQGALQPAGRALRVVLRSGCYLSHDSLHYARMQSRMRQRAGSLWGDAPSLRNALEVWACVLSVPERGRAICGMGKRDVSHDMELPQPLRWLRPGAHAAPQAVPPGLRLTALNDQHAYLQLDAGAPPLAVGDLLGFGVGHPCTTFDKWPLLHVVDDAGQVTGGIRTFF